MSERIIQESPYSYVLFESRGELILTYLSGGPVEVDSSIRLSNAQAEEIMQGKLTVEAFLAKIKSNPNNFNRLQQPVWPGKNAPKP